MTSPTRARAASVPASRSLRSRVATVVLIAFASAAMGASPATAVAAEGWPVAPDVSLWQYVLLLGLVPVGAAVLISLLVALPSLGQAQRDGGSSGRAPTLWLGGPRGGVATADREQPETPPADRGGAGGGW